MLGSVFGARFLPAFRRCLCGGFRGKKRLRFLPLRSGVFSPTPVRYAQKLNHRRTPTLLSVGLRSFPAVKHSVGKRSVSDCVDFQLAVRGKPRTRGNQITHYHVFLEARKVVAFAERCGFRENSRCFLERRRAYETFGFQAGFRDTQEYRFGGRGFTASSIFLLVSINS